MSISVANFLTQYLRPAIPNVTDFTDATLGYWIDAALLDISRSFPRTTYALWDAISNINYYGYSDSTTIADETTIMRVLSCLYPFDSDTNQGPAFIRKSHFDDSFLDGSYYDPDNDFQILYIGGTIETGSLIYADCHILWKTSSSNIINPPEHYELIRLFCIWQSVIHQLSDAASSAVPNSSLVNSLALERFRSERAYREAYKLLDQSKATSGHTDGWLMDKWDGKADGASRPRSGLMDRKDVT